MEKFNELKTMIASLEGDAKKFYEGGNKAAGTRLRKAMMEIKNLTSEIRKEVSEIKNSES